MYFYFLIFKLLGNVPTGDQNNNNNINAVVYCAITVMHMSADLQPTNLSSESAACMLLLSTATIAIYYYYSALKVILILPPDGG